MKRANGKNKSVALAGKRTHATGKQLKPHTASAGWKRKGGINAERLTHALP